MSGENAGKGAFRWPDGFTLSIILVCAAIELTFQLADHGFIATPRLRFLAYTYGGFWPGLLSDWQPNFPGQPVAMFLTYSVFHGGFWHFLFNMVTLVSLGAAIHDRGGIPRYAAIYVSSILGGAVVRLTLRPVLRVILILAVMNLVLWWAMDGQLAWQTHLGGFLAGAAAAAYLGEYYGDETPPGPSTSND